MGITQPVAGLQGIAALAPALLGGVQYQWLSTDLRRNRDKLDGLLTKQLPAQARQYRQILVLANQKALHAPTQDIQQMLHFVGALNIIMIKRRQILTAF